MKKKRLKISKNKTKDSYPCKGVGSSLQGKGTSPAVLVVSPQPLWFIPDEMWCPWSVLWMGCGVYGVSFAVALVLCSTAYLHRVPWGLLPAGAGPVGLSH